MLSDLENKIVYTLFIYAIYQNFEKGASLVSFRCLAKQ